MLDEDHFERFVRTVEPLMQAGRDVLWVLPGRTDSNLAKVEKILNKYLLDIEVCYLCYNTKPVSYTHLTLPTIYSV